jgi:phenylalanyl-tRNA synthetase beta chain
MRVPLSWLREFVPWDGDARTLAEALTGRGLAVAAVEASEAEGLCAASVLGVEPHPHARDLWVCTVLADGREAVVVSGASNLRPGMTVVWAAPGAVLPGGRAVAVRSIRGVASHGMLLSAGELGLPEAEPPGVLDLRPEDLPPGWSGGDLAEALHLADPILVFELTANYASHCQSVLGVAREVAALAGRPLPLAPAEEPLPGPAPTAAAVTVRVEVPAGCPRYVARVVEAVPGSRPGPLWMRVRLVQAGLRPVSGVVDVTNYVMVELGQPLHAFDLDRLAGGGVVVRAARDGERITTLDGRERRLEAGDLVIADAEGPVAIAGVMGGARTEVTAATRRVLLESAVFAPEAVGRTARRLGIPSAAAQRFARGVDPEGAAAAADRAAGLLARHLGAQPLVGAVDLEVPRAPRTITLRGRLARTLLGVRLSAGAAGRLLGSLGFGVQAAGPDRLLVTVPSWRPDVAEEVDLVEEVARAYGYDRIPAVLPGGRPGEAPRDPVGELGRLAWEVALASGFTEVLPYSFHDRALWDRLRLGPDHPWRRAVAVQNPMTQDQAVLRPAVAPTLLGVLERNVRRGRVDAAVFEVGRAFAPTDAEPEEGLRFGAAATGQLRPRSWQEPPVPADFFALKGLVEGILERAHVPGDVVTWRRPAAPYPFLHPGRSAELLASDGTLLGFVGELHPRVAAAFELRAPAAVAELVLPAVAALAGSPRPRPLPEHPPVRRDVSLLVPRDLPAAEVEQALRALGAPLLAGCRLFDVFEGPGVPAGRRSLTYALTFQDPGRTLTDEEVAEALARVQEGLRARGVEPRLPTS